LDGEGHFLDFVLAKGQEPALRPAEFLRRTVGEVLPLGLAAGIMRYIEQALQTGDTQVFEYQIPVPLPNGNPRDCEARIAVSGNDEVLAIVRDITARKRAEEALRESEERLRTVITNAPVVLFAIDRQGVFTIVEGRGLSGLGLRPGENVGRSVFDVYRDVPEVIDAARRALAGESFTATVELAGLTFEGHYGPLHDRHGRVCGGIGVGTDVSERKRAEEALRESEERFRRLSEATLEGIVIHDHGLLLDANPQAAAMLGYELPEIIGRDALSLMAPESRDLVRQHIVSGHEGAYEVLGLRKDGTTLPMEVCGKAASYEGRQVRVGVMRDISERKRAEEALQKAREELEARVERQTGRGNSYGLTFRELTVLHLMAAGEADKEIALQLGIRSRTASKHVENILQKMGAASRTEASVRALREGLVGNAG
jgi:PAS domain S-box-containing protein